MNNPQNKALKERKMKLYPCARPMVYDAYAPSRARTKGTRERRKRPADFLQALRVNLQGVGLLLASPKLRRLFLRDAPRGPVSAIRDDATRDFPASDNGRDSSSPVEK